MLTSSTNILVVDDQTSLRQLLSSLLKNIGLPNVHHATDGKHAMERIEGLAALGIRIHVILLDIDMPNVDGMTFLKVLRSRAELAHVQVIMLTADNQKSTVIAALKEGANGYILKPPTQDVLKAKLIEIGKKMA